MPKHQPINETDRVKKKRYWQIFIILKNIQSTKKQMERS